MTHIRLPGGKRKSLSSSYLNDRKAFPFDASQIELQDMGINQIPRPIIGGESETRAGKSFVGGFDGPERATEKAAAL